MWGKAMRGAMVMSGGALASYGALRSMPDMSNNYEVPVSSSDKHASLLGDAARYRLVRPKNPSQFRHSYVLGQVGKPEGLPHFDVFVHETGQQLVTVTKFGDHMTGHAGLVHGGATAATFDQILGIHFLKAVGAGFTAKLTVDYRKPIPLNCTVVFRSHLVKREGRKVFFEARAEDASGLVLAEASALFISADVKSLARAAARRVTSSVAPSTPNSEAPPKEAPEAME